MVTRIAILSLVGLGPLKAWVDQGRLIAYFSIKELSVLITVWGQAVA
jgi:hypothetical protein